MSIKSMERPLGWGDDEKPLGWDRESVAGSEKRMEMSTFEKDDVEKGSSGPGSSGSGSGPATREGSLGGPEEERRAVYDFPFFMTMFGLALTLLVAEATPILTSTCLTFISYDLKASSYTAWFTATYNIAAAAVSPFVGNMSDLFGRRNIVLVSLVAKVVSCILMGTATTLAPYLVGQVISGISIGVQLMTTIAGASELVPSDKRGAMLGFMVLSWMPFAPAPLYGQLIAEHSWRYIYILIGGLALLAFVILFVWYRPPPRESADGRTRKEILRDLDYGGCLLFTLGIVLVLIGINWGGTHYPWKSVQVICMLLFGALSLVLFVLYEIYIARYPMFPRRLWAEPRIYTAINVLGFCSGVNFVPGTIFWTILVYSVYNASYSQAGVWLLPLGFCIFGGVILGAAGISIFKKHIQWVMLVFALVQTAGFGSMAAFDPNNISSVFPSLVIGLIGMGAVLIPNQLIYTLIVPDDVLGTSVALSNVVRIIGQSVGNTIFFAVFNNRIQEYAPSLFGIPVYEAGITDRKQISGMVAAFTSGPFSRYAASFPQLDTPEKVALVQHAGNALYAKVLPTLFYVSIPFGLIAAISTLFMWGLKKHVNNRVAVHLH